MDTTKLPLPLFDSLEYIETTTIDFANYLGVLPSDFQHACAFLKCYRGSQGTFNSYRREIERLFQWCYLIGNKTLASLNRANIEEFVEFCQHPPLDWIGTLKAPRFIFSEGTRVANSEWRPFVATLSKTAHRAGKAPNIKKFNLSHGSIKEIFPILSTFFNYLLQEEYTSTNPVALIRQKSKFIHKQQGSKKIRRLTELQWQYVIESAEMMAAQQPQQHERTLFIMSALYSMYLRISELSASERWTPKMSDFHRDNDGNWWFTTVGKGNKEREIAVSDAMLEALKRWRKFLELPLLPSPADSSPLLPKINGIEPLTSINFIRRIVQSCFDYAVERLGADGFSEEAETLQEATVHWLRHTGISDDVKHRPRDHVRDDAGHSSGLITDRYVDVDRRERHQSARKKPISETV
jgi:site-specific recombinase XerD